MSKQQITAVTELDKSKYLTKVYAGGHFIYADEPAEIGGTDEGMTSAALLLASLGSCTAITLRMYADRKNMALDTIKIHLTLIEPEGSVLTTSIISKIEFGGNLSTDELNRLLQIADKCPVHKMLSNPILIETALA